MEPPDGDGGNGQCYGFCSEDDEPFCVEDNLCRCNSSQWMLVNCREYCEDKNYAGFESCGYNPDTDIFGCNCFADFCKGYTGSKLCCQNHNPCRLDGNEVCDCGGTCEWDSEDCSGQPQPDGDEELYYCPGYTGTDSCCTVDNPCNYDHNHRCECGGACAWDYDDCSAGPDGDTGGLNFCPGYTGSNSCCTVNDPCWWAYDGTCDCGGFCSWDVYDCSGADGDSDTGVCPGYPGLTLCCYNDDPCNYADDGFCDCFDLCAWDTNDCGGSTTNYCPGYWGTSSCCTPDDPCGWANDGFCDCYDTCDWDAVDCGSAPNYCPGYSGSDACCAIGDPCGLADNGVCDCDDTCSWDSSDCAASPDGDSPDGDEDQPGDGLCPAGLVCMVLSDSGTRACVEPGGYVPSGSTTGCGGGVGCDGNFACWCLDEYCLDTVCLENCGTCPQDQDCEVVGARGRLGCLEDGEIPSGNQSGCGEYVPCDGNFTCYCDNAECTETICVENCSSDHSGSDAYLCSDPYIISSLPFTHQGNTGTASNNLGLDGCEGSLWGASGPDHVFKYTASAGQSIRITLVPQYDGVISIRVPCNDYPDVCIAADDLGDGGTESMDIDVNVDTDVYIVADGYNSGSGAYQLTVEDL